MIQIFHVSWFALGPLYWIPFGGRGLRPLLQSISLGTNLNLSKYFAASQSVMMNVSAILTVHFSVQLFYVLHWPNEWVQHAVGCFCSLRNACRSSLSKNYEECVLDVLWLGTAFSQFLVEKNIVEISRTSLYMHMFPHLCKNTEHFSRDNFEPHQQLFDYIVNSQNMYVVFVDEFVHKRSVLG